MELHSIKSLLCSGKMSQLSQEIGNRASLCPTLSIPLTTFTIESFNLPNTWFGQFVVLASAIDLKSVHTNPFRSISLCGFVVG